MHFTDLPVLEHEKGPSISYENLRKIVHTIVQEVIKLPEFYNQKGFSSVDANQVQSSFEPKIYEDLLATAVINKVINAMHLSTFHWECSQLLVIREKNLSTSMKRIELFPRETYFSY